MVQVILEEFQMAQFCQHLEAGPEFIFLSFPPVHPVLLPDLRRLVNADKPAHSGAAELFKIRIRRAHAEGPAGYQAIVQFKAVDEFIQVGAVLPEIVARGSHTGITVAALIVAQDPVAPGEGRQVPGEDLRTIRPARYENDRFAGAVIYVSER